jgi:hypothetical protein
VNKTSGSQRQYPREMYQLADCNKGLGFFKDRPDLLQRAQTYLAATSATSNRPAQ